MLRYATPWLLLLTSACLAACSPATPDAKPAVQTAASAPPAVAAPCAPASAGAATSKTRHIPNEDDPCADSRGLARH